MNKKQVQIIWTMFILLSIISAGYGLHMFAEEETGRGVLFTFVIPILLIGGLTFYRAKEK